jgi:endonuclease/exonuclease/phosphatase family metal-dependent hydrolase
MKTFLRVATLNLNDRSGGAENFANFVLEKNLDVVCFNECGASLTQRLDAKMSSRGYSKCFSSAAFAGNTIFSRLPIQKATCKRLHSKGAEARSAAIIEVRVDISPWTFADICIASIHLDHVREEDRMKQFDSFLNIVSTLHCICH